MVNVQLTQKVKISPEKSFLGYCLLLATSPTQHRSIFFDSQITLSWRYAAILKKQGLGQGNGIAQYEMLNELG
jgi:hypothetical protein